jgi:hypothetical protein
MMRGLRENMIDRCCGSGGRCWCRSAKTCLFKRCENCDMPVDRDGRALYDDFGADHIDRHSGPCPSCNGPMPKP